MRFLEDVQEEQEFDRILGFVAGKFDLLLDMLDVLETEDLEEDVLGVRDTGR